MTCGACGETITGFAESCWYCPADMCGPCWEAMGHCGHPEADAINEASRTMTGEQRASMAMAIGLGEEVVKA